jgi:hypothetical protein
MGVGLLTGAVIGAAVASDYSTTYVEEYPVYVEVPVVIGTVVTTLPGGCSAVIVGDVSYQKCGATWYQPQFDGTTIEYVVVHPPQ